MTDRVLSENIVKVFHAMIRDGFDLTMTETSDLIASHRLQAARIQELEERVKWLNDCIDERNSDVNEA